MTRPQPFPSSPSYQAVIHSLLRMHRLTVDGRDESDEAESLRESMCDPWEALTEVERERIAGLSKDLYEISDNPSRAPEPMNPQAQRKLNEAYEARERGEWDTALGLLRRWGRYFPAPLVSYLRGTIWLAVGDAATASVFFENASGLEPDNEPFRVRLLDTLAIADPSDAAARAEAILQKNEKNLPAVVVCAAGISLQTTRGMSDADAMPIYQRLIPIVERALARMEGREDAGYSTIIGIATLLLATLYRRLGDTQRAYGYYSRAIQLDPNDDTLLTARGMLTYGAEPNATADFEQAIRLGSHSVWPYVYLAHHYLANNRFEDCRLMCDRALQFPEPSVSTRVRSELFEFLAISMASLGYPAHLVRQAFESSIRVDPSNDRARRNLERFENAEVSRSPQARDWEKRSESSLRSFAQEGNAWPDVASTGWHSTANV